VQRRRHCLLEVVDGSENLPERRRGLLVVSERSQPDVDGDGRQRGAESLESDLSVARRISLTSTIAVAIALVFSAWPRPKRDGSRVHTSPNPEPTARPAPSWADRPPSAGAHAENDAGRPRNRSDRGTIRLRFVDSNGEPLPRAEYQILGTQEENEVRGIADETGAARVVSSVGLGKELVATASGHGFGFASLAAPGELVVTVPPGRRVAGRVVDGAGRPLADVGVYARPDVNARRLRTRARLRQSTATDAQGRFEFKRLGAGQRHRLFLEHHDRPIADESTGLLIDAPASGVVLTARHRSFLLVELDAEDPGGADVLCTLVPSDKHSRSRRRDVRVRTPTKFLVPAAPGAWRLLLRKRPHPLVEHAVRVPGGAVTTVSRTTLQHRGGRLRLDNGFDRDGVVLILGEDRSRLVRTIESGETPVVTLPSGTYTLIAAVRPHRPVRATMRIEEGREHVWALPAGAPSAVECRVRVPQGVRPGPVGIAAGNGVAVAIYGETESYLFVGGKQIHETHFRVALEGSHEKIVVGHAGCEPRRAFARPGTRLDLSLDRKRP